MEMTEVLDSLLPKPEYLVIEQAGGRVEVHRLCKERLQFATDDVSVKGLYSKIIEFGSVYFSLMTRQDIERAVVIIKQCKY